MTAIDWPDDLDYLDGMDAFYPEARPDWATERAELEADERQQREEDWRDYAEGFDPYEPVSTF